MYFYISYVITMKRWKDLITTPNKEILKYQASAFEVHFNSSKSLSNGPP